MDHLVGKAKVLNRRAVLMALGLYVLLITVLTGTATTLFLDGFRAVERRQMERDLSRARDAITSSVAELDALVSDWSRRDALRRFLEDQDPSYLAPQVTDRTLEALRLDLWLLYDRSGRFAWGRQFNADARRGTTVTGFDLRDDLSPARTGLGRDRPDGRVAGLKVVGGRPLLLAARTLGDEQGRIGGFLVFARALDERRVSRLSETTHLTLTVVPVGDASMGPEYGEAVSAVLGTGEPLVRPLAEPLEGFVGGYLVLSDVHAVPALVLRVAEPRGIFEQGRRLTLVFLLVILAVAAIFATVVVWLVSKVVSSLVARRQSELCVEAAMRHHAFHDALTNLPNRLLFNDRLAQALAQARRTEESLAVMFLDMDEFKVVNDTLGHDIGDRLLIEVAERLKSAMRECDTVARQGGDEFMVLLPRIDGAGDAEAVATRMLERLRQPFELGGHEVVTSASIGIAVFPGHGATADDLAKNADIAMYQAKESGRNDAKVFDPAMHHEVTSAVHMKKRLAASLEAGEFLLHYQPQIEARSSRIRGVEALVRWNDPGRGMVPPDQFIPFAESTGMILPLGEWVLDQACRQARAWADQDLHLRVAVNLSTRQFRGPDLYATVVETLERHGLDPKLLELEITESATMQNADIARDVLARLRALGVTISLDDFGTGYSSLSYLRNFPFDVVKIDRTFIRELQKHEGDQAIVSGIIRLAHTLGLRVVAEGVETRRQLVILQDEGCDAVQGFGLVHPLPAAAIPAIVGREATLIPTLLTRPTLPVEMMPQ